MSSFSLMALRLLALTLGRFPAGSRLIRALLLRVVRRKGRITYVAHADFLDLRDLLPAQAPPRPLVAPERIHG